MSVFDLEIARREKADAAAQELRILHNAQFAERIIAGVKKLAESCARRRDKYGNGA